MPRIELLDQITIDKIAAGEVIERPASVVKELVENAIDAGATAVVVEIEEGGISLMRITDNGCGIEPQDVRNAFLRHSTSKIRCAEDLMKINSLGFRGEALSSISAVSQVELITKTKDNLYGTRYVIEGGKEKLLEEAGAPNGTTFIIRQLFYNTPARRKFLRTPMTEASHINDLLIRLALSHPEISFEFINNHQTKLHTSGNGNLKDVIYHIYGRDVASNLLELDVKENGIHVKGYLGKPIISRGNRNFENYFVNGRYVKSNVIAKGIEDAYKDFSMQHKYPFVVFHLNMDQEAIDVNVHPTKMELRFSNQQEVYNTLYGIIRERLLKRELVPRVELPERKPIPQTNDLKKTEVKKAVAVKEAKPNYGEEKNLDYFMKKMKERVNSYHSNNSHAEVKSTTSISNKALKNDKIKQAVNKKIQDEANKTERTLEKEKPIVIEKEKMESKECAKTEHAPRENEQLTLFENKMVEVDIRQEYRIIGQVFDTYWLLEFRENLYIIDQHAAHERVLYERTLKGLKNREYTSQYISPPIILSLTMQEATILETYKDSFTKIGFEIESFGGDEYAVRAVPDNLFGIAKKELLIEMLDELSGGIASNTAAEMIDEKIASMSCKAAVKGKARISLAEVDSLMAELLKLENPYHCPHGRPTIIAMTKKELEKKFKRIV